MKARKRNIVICFSVIDWTKFKPKHTKQLEKREKMNTLELLALINKTDAQNNNASIKTVNMTVAVPKFQTIIIKVRSVLYRTEPNEWDEAKQINSPIYSLRLPLVHFVPFQNVWSYTKKYRSEMHFNLIQPDIKYNETLVAE